MGAAYNWDPFFASLNNVIAQTGQRNQYNNAVQGMFGTSQINPVQVTPQVAQPNLPQLPHGTPLGDPARAAALNAPIESMDGPLGSAFGGQAPAMQKMFQALGPQGMPLLMQTGMNQMERQQNISDKKITPLSDAEATSLGLRPGGVYGRDISGNVVTVQPSDMESTGAAAQKLGQEKDLAQFTNKLPMTANEIAANKVAQQNANKPVFAPYGATGYMQGGEYKTIPGGGSAAFGNGDAASTSINGQTGLSSMGYNYITGNTSQMGMRDKEAASKEVDAFIARSGLDATVVKPKVQAYQSAVTMNTLKANTMDTLGKEVVGTVKNYAPVIDQLTGNGNLRFTNKGFELFGSAVNDPTAQKAVYFLGQMRADMAGFNAASGGKIGLHGQTQTDNADFAKADEIIKNGLSSGGAMALAQAIDATREKNVAIANQQSLDAQRNIWNTLGVGKNFDATHPGSGQAAPPPPIKTPPATEADIQHTMTARKLTRQQVLDGLKQRGIPVAP